MPEKIHSYADLLGCVREVLRKQHPEWVGQRHDQYEARLAGLLGLFAARSGSGGMVNTLPGQ